MTDLVTDVLTAEYDTLIARLGENATDDQIAASLVRDADWTAQSAQEVLHLARKYGTSILRNALSLAAAMNIEDGDAGL